MEATKAFGSLAAASEEGTAPPRTDGAAANAGGGGALQAFPSPLDAAATSAMGSMNPPCLTPLPAPERFQHPSRWPSKTDSLRVRGATRLAPVSETVTPRRLRTAPWGIPLGFKNSSSDEETEKNTTKVSSSVLRVGHSSPSSPSPSSPSPSSCFPRTAVRRSRIAGLGLYALARISRGSAVAEYSGELVRASLVDMRERDYARLGLGESFF